MAEAAAGLRGPLLYSLLLWSQCELPQLIQLADEPGTVRHGFEGDGAMGVLAYDRVRKKLGCEGRGR